MDGGGAWGQDPGGPEAIQEVLVKFRRSKSQVPGRAPS